MDSPADTEAALSPATDAARPLRPLRLEYVDPASLDAHPRNWRRHPVLQKEALEGALDEIGWAGALLYNERSNRLVDGHARKELALKKGIAAVPVLIGSWSDADEAKILTTLDPLAAMAETDPVMLDALLRDVETGNQALATLITQLAEEARLIPPEPADDPSREAGGEPSPEAEPAGDPEAPGQVYALKVNCTSAGRRDDLLASLRAEGYDCSPL